MVGRMVHYSGRVQGVGFRATAASLARRWPVTGWVRNLSDGRVQMLVEGPEADVEAFLQSLRDTWTAAIAEEIIEPQSPTGQYRTFAITH